MPENTAPVTPPLHVCAGCGSHLVDLVDASEIAPGLWDVTLRCPECERVVETCCREDSVARLERRLFSATEELERELERFARTRFEEDVALFVRALQADAILPMDFGVAR